MVVCVCVLVYMEGMFFPLLTTGTRVKISASCNEAQCLGNALLMSA